MLDFWDAAGAVPLAAELLPLLLLSDFGVPEPPTPVYDFRREGMMRTIVVGDYKYLGPS
jgi:hypothetical protein